MTVGNLIKELQRFEENYSNSKIILFDGSIFYSPHNVKIIENGKPKAINGCVLID